MELSITVLNKHDLIHLFQLPNLLAPIASHLLSDMTNMQ